MFRGIHRAWTIWAAFGYHLHQLGDHVASTLDNHGIAFAVRNMSADYIRPAKLDDALTVHSRLLALRGASMSAEQIVRRNDEDLVRLTMRLACIDRQGRPARLPSTLRQALETYRHDVQ